MPKFEYEPSYIVHRKQKTFRILSIPDMRWLPADETLPKPMHNPHHAKGTLRKFLNMPTTSPHDPRLTPERRRFIASIGNPPPHYIRPMRLIDLVRVYRKYHPDTLEEAWTKYATQQ